MLEALVAYRQGKAVYDIPDAITSLHQGVLSQLSGLIFKMVFIGLYVTVFEHYKATAFPADNLLVWILALVFYDFCYYWSHRLYHEVSIFWASHIVHHSSDYYNLSTALRQPSTDWLFGWLFFLPLAVAGVPPDVFIGVGLIDLLYQYWVHTELVGRLGWIDSVLVTPSNHRVHHGKNDYCIDKNYGGIFIIWDRIFGTFEMERADEKIMYGIRTPLHSYNPLWGVVHYYYELWQTARTRPDWRSSLGVLIAPPGGWSEVGLTHLDTTGMVRFRWPTPTSIRWYVVVQYVLSVPFFMHCIAIGDQLSATDLTLYVAFLVVTMQVLGALLNTSRFSVGLELVRTLAVGLGFAMATFWFGDAIPIVLKGVVPVVMVASAAWLMAETRKLKHNS